MTVKERLRRLVDEMPEEEAKGAEDLLHKIEGLSQDKREEASRFIESLKELSPKKRHIALMDRLAASISEEDLKNVPSDLSENWEKYAS